MTPRADLAVVVPWYEEKTDFLLDKYGPGPRVHYHTGLAPAAIAPSAERAVLRRQLYWSQERMMWRCDQAWGALGDRVLDVGCGLGGGSIFWAERGAAVTALTPVPTHLPWVRRLADEAEVGRQVEVVLGDAHELSRFVGFDAVVSMGASNYFDRALHFAAAAGTLRPGGRVLIEDTLLGRPELCAPFNDYWSANIGWLDEYDAAAAAAGFERMSLHEVTTDAAGFWKLSVAWSEAMLAHDPLDDAGRARRHRSIDWQRRIFAAYLDGGFRNLLLEYRLR